MVTEILDFACGRIEAREMSISTKTTVPRDGDEEKIVFVALHFLSSLLTSVTQHL